MIQSPLGVVLYTFRSAVVVSLFSVPLCLRLQLGVPILASGWRLLVARHWLSLCLIATLGLVGGLLAPLLGPLQGPLLVASRRLVTSLVECGTEQKKITR